MKTGKTVLVAAKDLTIDGVRYEAGATLATVEAGVTPERVLNGLQNGAVIDGDEFKRKAKPAAGDQAKPTNPDRGPSAPPVKPGP